MTTRLNKQQAIERLQRQINQADTLKQDPYASAAFKKWHRDTEIAITNIFGDQSRHFRDFNQVDFRYWGSYNTRNVGEYERKSTDNFRQRLADTQAILQSMVEEVEEYWDDEMISTPSAIAEQNEAGQVKLASRKVFIVHGHDSGFKNAVARFLTKLDLEPIILHEQPNQGRTIIEKFNDYADVSYAIALFTPDDLGEAKGKVTAVEHLKARARQNVVFELGYFIGRLGRSKACALVSPGIERPSDFDGVVYIPMDTNDAWHMALFRELRAAGFDLDANRIL